jgi:3-mercaptopyruvate sulfurtransferase SseA
MSTNATPLLITPARLAALMAETASRGQKDSIRILDATWFMPNVKRSPLEEFRTGPRIPGSSFWDVESVASLKEEVDEDGQSLNPLGLGHMMPSAEKFAKAAGEQQCRTKTPH